MPDDAPLNKSSEASLDELERRLATFESATKRLNRTVDGLHEPTPQQQEAGHASPPRPATRRFSESATPRSDEISGLRPAVQAQGPQTGALTARARQTGNATSTPGFTSAYGKPAIPVISAPPAQTPTVGTTPALPPHSWSRRIRPAMIAAVVILLLLIILSRSFRQLPDAAVWAETTLIQAPVAGPVSTMPIAAGEPLQAGALLARIGSVEVVAPCQSVVTRLLVTTGSRVAAGETIAELAMPQTTRVVVALQGGSTLEKGERVSVRLLAQRRNIGGMVETILAPGEPGAWTGGGPAPLRAVIRLDAAAIPPAFGQGARVTPLGSTDPGPATMALFALRQMLPW